MAYRRGITQGLRQGQGNISPEDVFNQAVREALKRKSFDHAALAIGTTKDRLQELIEGAITEGKSIQQLSKDIRDQFDVDGKVRPLRIARTEMTDTINDGTAETLRREGFREKEWSTVIDGRERESHAQADGQIVGMDDFFRIGGESCRFPGDDALSAGERINCRCAVLGAGLSEDRRAILGQSFLRAHGNLEKKLVVSLRRAFFEQRDRVLSHFPL